MFEKVRLNRLLVQNMSAKQLKMIRGMGSCVCGCCYTKPGEGGSAQDDNGEANRDEGGLTSPCGGTIYLPEVIVTPTPK